MQNNNRHALNLYNSLLKHTDEHTADELASHYPLSKSAVFEKKFRWAEDICQFLESRYDDKTIQAIRMDCACGPSPKRMEKIKQLYTASHSLEEFAEKYNNANLGSTVRCEGKTLFLCYPVCYCPCVKRTDKPLSKAWCYCTLGYTKRLFDDIFGCETEAELLESVKTGGSRCVIKVTKI